MWKSKKFIIIAVLAAVVLVGGIVGVACANTGAGTTPGKATLRNAISGNTTARVAQILGIDQQKLDSAFTQARQEMRDKALDDFLKNLVAQNKITQKQADDYKAWLKSKPNMPAFGPQNFGMHRFPGRGGMMGGGRNFQGKPAPSPTPTQ